jgi:hypothetical protein
MLRFISMKMMAALSCLSFCARLSGEVLPLDQWKAVSTRAEVRSHSTLIQHAKLPLLSDAYILLHRLEKSSGSRGAALSGICQSDLAG